MKISDRIELIFMILVMVFVIVFLIFIGGMISEAVENKLSQEDKIKELEAEIKSLETVIITINAQNEALFEISDKALKDLERLHIFLEKFQLEEFEITNYAPLGSGAIEGMCFEGDPNITASGQQFIPYLSAAASSDIPFGTKLYVEGFGYYEVHDRGGMITKGKLDLGVQETDEAYGFGRQKRMVLIEKYDN